MAAVELVGIIVRRANPHFVQLALTGTVLDIPALIYA
jgi:hypothetical protein